MGKYLVRFQSGSVLETEIDDFQAFTASLLLGIAQNPGARLQLAACGGSSLVQLNLIESIVPAPQNELIGRVIKEWVLDRAVCHFCGSANFPWRIDDAIWAEVEPLLGQHQTCFTCFSAAWIATGHESLVPTLIGFEKPEADHG